MSMTSSGIDYDVADGEVCLDVGSISVWLTKDDLLYMLEELRSKEK